MTNPNWSLLNAGGGFQNALAQGYQIGSEARVRREETERQNALAAYAANPDDPKAIQGAVRADPKLGVSIIEKQRERREEAELGQLTQRAMAGDRTAMDQLATRNFDRWKALDGAQRDATKQKATVLGNAAMDVLNRPAEQRRAAVAAYAQQLGGQFPGVAQLAQLPDDQLEAALRGAVAEAGMVEKLISMEQPRYQAIPEGGTLVDTSNPQAVQSFMANSAAPAPSVPPAAVDALRRGEGTAEQFDQMFGPGAAARALGNGGAGASRIGSNFLEGL